MKTEVNQFKPDDRVVIVKRHRLNGQPVEVEGWVVGEEGVVVAAAEFQCDEVPGSPVVILDKRGRDDARFIDATCLDFAEPVTDADVAAAIASITSVPSASDLVTAKAQELAAEIPETVFVGWFQPHDEDEYGGPGTFGVFTSYEKAVEGAERAAQKDSIAEPQFIDPPAEHPADNEQGGVRTWASTYQFEGGFYIFEQEVL